MFCRGCQPPEGEAQNSFFSPEGAKEVSYTNLNYHIVFSTKERRPFLSDELRRRTGDYIGGIIRELRGDLVAAGGATDHLHLAAVLHPQVSISDVVRTIKANSSKWIHETLPDLAEFGWQDGYAAFSVSRSVLPQVVRYIEGQKEHHAKMSFTEELIALLKRHGVDYDERYLV